MFDINKKQSNEMIPLQNLNIFSQAKQRVKKIDFIVRKTQNTTNSKTVFEIVKKDLNTNKISIVYSFTDTKIRVFYKDTERLIKQLETIRDSKGYQEQNTSELNNNILEKIQQFHKKHSSSKHEFIPDFTNDFIKIGQANNNESNNIDNTDIKKCLNDTITSLQKLYPKNKQVKSNLSDNAFARFYGSIQYILTNAVIMLIPGIKTNSQLLLKAIQNNDIENIEKLLGKETSKPKYLIAAAFNGNIDIIQILIEHGVDINAKDKNGYTALMYATENGHTACANKLLENGAKDTKNIDAQIKKENKANKLYGNTPLIVAAIKGNVQDIKNFIRNPKLDINERNIFDSTALIYAAKYGNIQCLELLLANNACINQANNSGNTALILAAENGHSECVKKLLDSGANKSDRYGYIALRLAKQKGHTECVSLLLQS